jgi:protein-tyrosine-phosphatase
MRRRMSEFLLEAGYGEYAAAHRSRRWEQVAEPDGIDLVIGVAPVHMRRLAEIAPGMRSMMTQERITDPVFGNQADYLLAWEQIMDAARWLAEVIPS